MPVDPDYEPWVLAIDGDWLVLANPWSEVGGSALAGAVHLVHRREGQWSYWGRLTSESPSPNAAFGSSAAVSGKTLVVGAKTTGWAPGSLHVFELQGERWSEAQTISGGSPYAQLGVGVVLDGDWMLAGASNANDPANEPGTVHFFHREVVDGTPTWVLAQSFEHPTEFFPGSFGYNLALDGDLALAAAPGNTGGSSLETVAYRRLSDGAWVQSQLIAPPDLLDSGWTDIGFGDPLDLEGADLVMRGPSLSDAGGLTSTAFHYRWIDGHWDLLGRLVRPHGRGAKFVDSIALVHGRALVGYPHEDGQYDLSGGFPTFLGAAGAVHVYDLSADAQQYCSCEAESPCANPDSHGGCTNSTGAGGVLASAGTGSLAADDLRLQAFDLPKYQVAVLTIGDDAASLPFGDGQLCVGGAVVYAPGAFTGVRGQVDWEPGLAGLAASLGDVVQAGESRYVQLVYRDPLSPCGTGVNLTNAVRVDFKP